MNKVCSYTGEEIDWFFLYALIMADSVQWELCRLEDPYRVTGVS